MTSRPEALPSPPGGPAVPAAVVFDFDGLILDTEWPIYHSANEAFMDHGVELPFELWQGFIGRLDHPHWTEILADTLGRPVDRDQMLARYLPAREELIASLPIQPGIAELIGSLGEHGVPLAVASSSSVEWVAGHLERLGLYDRFDSIHGGNHVAHRKPAPDLYQLACSSLDVEPARAVALEDSLTGCDAAIAAGMAVVAIPSRMTIGLDFSHADLVVESAFELDVALLGALVRGSRHRGRLAPPPG